MAFIYVGVGGFLGSCLRYLLAVFFRNLGVAFPLGTLVSNVIAGLLIGFIIGMKFCKTREVFILKKDFAGFVHF